MSLIIIGCIFIITIIYLISTVIKPSNYPPGPIGVPIFGDAFLMKKLAKQLGGQHNAFLKLHDDYKSDIIGLNLSGDRYVVVFGRKLVQQVYTRNEFQGRPDGFFLRLRTMGTKRGITMTDGKLWHEQRNFAERQLRQSGFGKRTSENLMKEQLENFFKSLQNKREDISFHQSLSVPFLNVLWTIVGGKQFSEDDKVSELLNLLQERSKAFDMAGGLLNQVPWLRFIAPHYSGYTCIRTMNAKLYQLFQEIIDEHKNTITSETRDFVDAYLHEKESSDSDTTTFTDEQLVAVCLDFFIAGALTTTYTLNFAIIATVGHPQVQQKLHQEIDKVLPRGQIPSIEDKARLPYVEALLQESQRFQHVAPTGGPRRVLRDTILDGYNIPQNTVVFLSLRSIHYDKQEWKDPELFKPERFLTEDGQFIPDEGLSTFGLGKRRCPGETLAKNFLFLAFVALFGRYKITFSPGKEPNAKPQGGILLTPPPYSVNLQARDDYDM